MWELEIFFYVYVMVSCDAERRGFVFKMWYNADIFKDS